MADAFPLGVEFTSRYGADLPDPGTMCPGDCEGLGVVPIPAPHDVQGPWRKADALVSVSDDDPVYAQAWRESSSEPDEIGYKFLTCKDCGGSGLA